MRNIWQGGGGGRTRRVAPPPSFKQIAPSGGRRENCWGISCGKSRFYAKKILFFPILGGGGGAPWIRPWLADYIPAVAHQI